MKEDKLVLPTLTPEDAKTIYAAGTDYGFRPLDYVDYTDYKQCIELFVTQNIGKGNVVSRRGGVLLMNNIADLCRECELMSKTRELEEAIKELIIAINDSNFCTTCSDEFGTLACSECPWHQAKARAIRLLAKEEEAE